MATKKTKKTAIATGKKKGKSKPGKRAGTVDRPYRYVPPKPPPHAMIAKRKKKGKATARKHARKGFAPANTTNIIPPKPPGAP
jgi:hypothetical protein